MTTGLLEREAGADLGVAPADLPYPRVSCMFSDIEASTAMTERIGDFAMHGVLLEHEQLVRAEVAGCKGILAGSRGDGFMMVFPSPRHAVRCAMRIQRSVAASNARRPGLALQVRLGIHTGPAVQRGEEFFGRTVVAAARIAAEAAGGEILVSSDVLDEVGGEFTITRAHRAQLRGLAGVHVLHHVSWQRITQRDLRLLLSS